MLGCQRKARNSPSWLWVPPLATCNASLESLIKVSVTSSFLTTSVGLSSNMQHGVSPVKQRELSKRQNNYLGTVSQNTSNSRSPPTHSSLMHSQAAPAESSSSYEINKLQAIQNVKNNTYGTIKSQLNAPISSMSLYSKMLKQKKTTSSSRTGGSNPMMLSPNNSPREPASHLEANSRNKHGEAGQHLHHMQSAMIPNGHKSNRSGADGHLQRSMEL